jgi:hypothetical protein
VAYGIRRDGSRHLLAFLRSQGESQADWCLSLALTSISDGTANLGLERYRVAGSSRLRSRGCDDLVSEVVEQAIDSKAYN